MSDTIFLFTDYYPYGTEEVFVHNELSSTVAGYYDIYVVPYRKRNTLRTLPSCATLVTDVAESSIFMRAYAMLRVLFSRHLYRVPLDEPRPRTFRQWKNAIGGLYRGYLTYLCIKKNKEMYRDADVLYSYWCDNTLLGLSLAKDGIKCLNDTPIISRAHGFDVYGRERGMYFPARDYAFSHVEKILTVSSVGAAHMRSHYPHWADKIGTMYLGVNDFPDVGHDFQPGRLRFVSCSNLLKLKRVEMIAEYLSKYATAHPDVEVSWTHFGSGVTRDEVDAVLASMPSPLSVCMRGTVPNADILQEYLAGKYDIFISLSNSEGVPMSVMEAMSCGIVPLCTDAGGTNEALGADGGVLLSLNPDYAEFERGVDRVVRDWERYSDAARARQRTNFSLQSNFAAFYRFLSRLKY